MPFSVTSRVVVGAEDTERLAFSHAVRSRRIALALDLSLFAMPAPLFFSNSATAQSTSLLSKSSPPRWVSPPVAFTYRKKRKVSMMLHSGPDNGSKLERMGANFHTTHIFSMASRTFAEVLLDKSKRKPRLITEARDKVTPRRCVRGHRSPERLKPLILRARHVQSA